MKNGSVGKGKEKHMRKTGAVYCMLCRQLCSWTFIQHVLPPYGVWLCTPEKMHRPDRRPMRMYWECSSDIQEHSKFNVSPCLRTENSGEVLWYRILWVYMLPTNKVLPLCWVQAAPGYHTFTVLGTGLKTTVNCSVFVKNDLRPALSFPDETWRVWMTCL